MIIFTIIIFLCLSIIYSFYPLIREKQWLELFITLVIFAAGSAYSLEYYFDTSYLPNLGDLLDYFVPWAEKLAAFSQPK